jgi:hypothetical protein
MLWKRAYKKAIAAISAELRMNRNCRNTEGRLKQECVFTNDILKLL